MAAVTLAAAYVATTAYSAYDANQKQKKAANAQKKFAANPANRMSSAYRTPYQNQYIQQIVPYILQEAQGIYSQRQGMHGRSPGDFTQIQNILGGLRPENEYTNPYGYSNNQGQGSLPSNPNPYGNKINPFDPDANR